MASSGIDGVECDKLNIVDYAFLIQIEWKKVIHETQAEPEPPLV